MRRSLRRCAAGALANEALAEPVKLGGLAIDPSELAINAEAIRKAWRDGIQDVLKAHAEQIEQAARELGSVNRASARAAGALAELNPAILRAHVSPDDAEALARLAALTPDPYLAPALENAGRWLAADWAQVEADLASEMRQRLAGGVYVHLKWAGTPDAGEPGTTDPALVGQLASLVLSDEQPASPPANPLEALANAMRERQTISDGRYLRLRKASELDQEQPASNRIYLDRRDANASGRAWSVLDQEQPAASPEAGTLTDEQLAADDNAAAGALAADSLASGDLQRELSGIVRVPVSEAIRLLARAMEHNKTDDSQTPLGGASANLTDGRTTDDGQ